MDRVTEIINCIGKDKYQRLKSLFLTEIFGKQSTVEYNNVNGAILDDILDGVIKFGTDDELYLFATNVKNAPLDKIMASLRVRGNILLINNLNNKLIEEQEIQKVKSKH